jgi:hypothetical protein
MYAMSELQQPKKTTYELWNEPSEDRSGWLDCNRTCSSYNSYHKRECYDGCDEKFTKVIMSKIENNSTSSTTSTMTNHNTNTNEKK